MNRIGAFNDGDYFQRIIYAVHTCRSSSIEWSLDGKYLKINYYHFYKEYLCAIPTSCKSAFDFVSIMVNCGFRCVYGPYEGENDELVFIRLEECDQLFRSWELSDNFDEMLYEDRLNEKVNMHICVHYKYVLYIINN